MDRLQTQKLAQHFDPLDHVVQIEVPGAFLEMLLEDSAAEVGFVTAVEQVVEVQPHLVKRVVVVRNLVGVDR